ncbi:MAG: hypothetical protein IJC95_06150, partial [Clostridia bacterium]|nr:hypothetical protein [Clostridia bacterium]
EHQSPKLGVVGSSPPAPAKKIRQVSTCRIFLSKPQAWHIIAAQRAVHIISPGGAVSHHAPACISLRLDDIQCFALMIYRNKLRMIYTPSA